MSSFLLVVSGWWPTREFLPSPQRRRRTQWPHATFIECGAHQRTMAYWRTLLSGASARPSMFIGISDDRHCFSKFFCTPTGTLAGSNHDRQECRSKFHVTRASLSLPAASEFPSEGAGTHAYTPPLCEDGLADLAFDAKALARSIFRMVPC